MQLRPVETDSTTSLLNTAAAHGILHRMCEEENILLNPEKRSIIAHTFINLFWRSAVIIGDICGVLLTSFPTSPRVCEQISSVLL